MTLNLTYTTPPAAAGAPRLIGTTASGIIAVPVLGGITTDEDTDYTLIQADQPSTFEAAAKLAEAWHVEHGITRAEGYAIIQAHLAGVAQEPAALEIALAHAQQLETIKRDWLREFQTQRLAAVLTLLRHRCGQAAATIDDVRRQPRVLIDGLYALWQDEQAVKADPPEPMTEDVLKKPPEGQADVSQVEPGPPPSGILPTTTPDSSTAKRSVKN